MAKKKEIKCVGCAGDVVRVKGTKLKQLASKLGFWKLVKQHHLEREYKFKDFKSALKFTNKVGALAEKESHHPDFYLAWGQVKLTLWTHKIDGLTENDFLFAHKVNKLGNG